MSDHGFVNAGLVCSSELADPVADELYDVIDANRLPLTGVLNLAQDPGQASVQPTALDHAVSRFVRGVGVRQGGEPNLYLLWTTPDQVAPLMQAVLRHSEIRPLTFVIAPALHELQLRVIENIRDAHRGVVVTFRRNLRHSPVDPVVAPASAVTVRHHPDATDPDLHQLIDYGLYRLQDPPTHCRFDDAGRFKIAVGQGSAARYLTLAADPSISEFLVEVADAKGVLTLGPDTLLGFHPLRRLLGLSATVLDDMHTWAGDDRDVVDRFLREHGAATIRSERSAADMVARRKQLLAGSTDGPGQP